MDEEDVLVPRTRDRIARLALAFVVLSLAALVTLPTLRYRRMAALRVASAQGPDLARSELDQVAASLARQMAALRGLVLTDDPRYRTEYQQAALDERKRYAAMAPAVQRVAGQAPETRQRLAELRLLSRHWHALVQREITTPQAPSRIARLRTEEEVYDRTFAAVEALDESLARVAARQQAAIAREERHGLWSTAFLVGLALLSALVVEWLGWRMQRLAAQTQRALSQTQMAMDAHNRLVRGVTHDIKNPLGAADGFAALLEMGAAGELSPPQEQHVKGVRRSLRGALRIIDDLLDLARADAGLLRVERAPVELAGLVSEVVEEHRGAAEAAGHTLSLSLPAPPLPVLTDAGRVRQVLGNLLSNAIKYTPSPGHVGVRVDLAGGDGTPRRVEVSVEDSGPGIPPEEREDVFLEFHRLETGRIKGHGVGLAISRRIARLLGGDLTAGEGEGGGAVFTLTLPAEEPEAG
jgi:signal transduction histidine kinase